MIRSFLVENAGIILNILVLIFAILMASIPLRFDIVKRDKNKNYTGLTKAGRWFVVFAILALVFGTIKIFYDQYTDIEKTKKIDIQGGQIKKQGEDIGKLEGKADSLISINKDLKNVVDNLANNKNEEKPSIKDNVLQPILSTCPLIYYNRQNPMVENADSLNYYKYSLSVCNIGNGIAKNLHELFTYVSYDLSKNFYYAPVTKTLSNKSVLVSPNQPGVVFSMFLSKNETTGYQYFLTFTLKYSDIKGNNFKHLNKVYQLNGNHITEASNDDFNRVETELINRKVWIK